MADIPPSPIPTPSTATTTTSSSASILTPSTTTAASSYDTHTFPPNPTPTPQPSTTSFSTTASTNEFTFPPHYSFPPFFTLQPVLSTRTSQLQSWSSLIQSHCRHTRTFALSLIDALETPLFHNRALARRLSLRDARAIVEWMTTSEGGHRAEWIDAGGGGKKRGGGVDEEGAGGRFYVYWRRPEEWASVIEKWVEETGQKGTVLTLYEIVESDATSREEFHGMDGELLQRSLQGLVKRGRAQVFGESEGMGVKFF